MVPIRRMLSKVKRIIRRYTRQISVWPRGNITLAAPDVMTQAERDSRAYFDFPGTPSRVPKAVLSGVLNDRGKFHLPPEGDYGVLQGGCTDGTYAYFVLENQKLVKEGVSPFAECVLVKVDMRSWEIVGKSSSLPLNHGNDLTYNPRIKKIVAVHCYDRPNHISFIDPDTLQIIETREYFHSVYGIAYNEKRNQYVMAIRGGYDFAVFDSRFELLFYIKGVDTRFVKQGIDCDDDFIYFSTSEKNAIVCYDWSGNYRGVYAVKGCDKEVENLFHIGNIWYISYYISSNNGGDVYRVHFDRSLLEIPQECG